MNNHNVRIAAILPCFGVAEQILPLLASFGPEVEGIFVVDDCCPQGTADLVEAHVTDKRVTVIRHTENQGVGGATMTGLKAAARAGFDIGVKVDGDGQMDPSLIPMFVAPILEGHADYTKGNRFSRIEGVRSMPPIRLYGNAILSILTKMSSGYWDVFDPTNGYVALHLRLLNALPTEKIAKRYFFESDILFRLNTIRAKVMDIPMDAVYGDEKSNLKITKILFPFIKGHVKNSFKRIFYSYLLRDFNVGTFYLTFGLIFLLFGSLFGLEEWISNAADGKATPAGTVMIAALPIILGFQLVLSFLAYDVGNVPKISIHPLMTLYDKHYLKKLDKNDL